MRTKISALLLALILVFAMTTGALATDAESNNAQLTVSTAIQSGKIEATVYLQAAQGATNGRIEVAYDPEAAVLEGTQVLVACAAASVNSETAGTVSLAWVGSQLTGENTAILRLTFRFAEDAELDVSLTATAPEVYAGETPVEVAEGTAVVAYNPFTDIDGHWARTDILKAYHAGLFQGVTDTTFVPEGKLDRAMFITVLYRMAGSPEVENTETGFTDLEAGRYYVNAVAWAVETGVTKGTSATTFSPHKTLDRQEAATLLYRYAQLTGKDVTARADLSGFQDGDKISGWAKEAMAWAVAEEILKGYPGNLLVAGGSTTRAQAAAILVRYAGI